MDVEGSVVGPSCCDLSAAGFRRPCSAKSPDVYFAVPKSWLISSTSVIAR